MLSLRHVHVLNLPAFRALSIQVAAAAIAGVSLAAWHFLDLPEIPVAVWLLVQAATAALLADRIAMARWWVVIHLAFLPTLALVLALELPPWFFLAGFIVLLLVHGPTYQTQVPTHLSRRKAIELAAGLMPDGTAFRCLDLGCGFGGVLSALAKLRPAGRYQGIEGAALPFAIAWIRGRLAGYRVRWGSIWNADLGAYDVVYVYLSPACMERLWEKASREMRPGSLLISNSFGIPGVLPACSLSISGAADSKLHVWRIGCASC